MTNITRHRLSGNKFYPDFDGEGQNIQCYKCEQAIITKGIADTPIYYTILDDVENINYPFCIKCAY